MTSKRVEPRRRFTLQHPCPTCGGFGSQSRGNGVRCFGFISADMRFAHCTREEHAGSLLPSRAGTYAHLLDGRCRCGSQHAARVQANAETTTKELNRSVDFNRCVRPYPCDYQDESGRTLFRVARWPSEGRAKSYSMHHLDESGKWLPGRGDNPRIVYRLREIREAVSTGQTIHVCEGEKKVHLLLELGLHSTTCSDGGAGKWGVEHSLSLRGATRVVLWADNDDPGRRHVDEVACSLLATGIGDVRIPALTGLAEGEGIDDWIERCRSVGATNDEIREELEQLADAAGEATLGVPSKHCKQARGAVITRLSQVHAEPIDWLWRAWIPMGMLTILDGDPGLGKSTLLLDLAARLSRGRDMPDGTPGPPAGGTVILTAEDDPARVVRPRLEVAGADTEKIGLVRICEAGGNREPLITPGDLAALIEAVDDVQARLVIVDPLMAYLPNEVNTNRDQHVRRALVLLKRVAEQANCAVIAVRHLNKSLSSPALYRGGGSIGIIAAARAGLLMAADPNAPSDSRVLAVTKSNLAPKPTSLRLRLVQADAEPFARVEWLGSSEHSATSLLAPAEAPHRESALKEAMEFLTEVLASGQRSVRAVEREAKQAGISHQTLRRARKQLGIVPRKLGRPGTARQRWCLVLPGVDVEPSPKAPTTLEGDHLRGTQSAGGSYVGTIVDDGQPEPHDPSSVGASIDAVGIGPAIDRLRNGENGNRLRDLLVAEGGQLETRDRLREGGVPTHPQSMATEVCPDCGGATLRWDFGVVCTHCHARVEEHGPGGAISAHSGGVHA